MRRHLACLAVPLALFFGAAGGSSHAQDEAPNVFVAQVEGEIDDRTAGYVSEAERDGAAAADGTRVEPRGLTLRTRDALLVQKPPSFEGRTGISPYLLWALAGIAALALALVAFAYWRMVRGQVTTGAEGMVGEVGTVRRPVVEGADGLVFVHGERWRAIRERPEYVPISVGTRVEVVALREGAVVVRPAGPPAPEEG